MTEDHLTDLLADLADRVPHSDAPLGELLADGHRSVRRRRSAVAGAVVGVLVIVGGGVAAQQLWPAPHGSAVASGPPREATDVPVPNPPDGMRWVGRGNAVVAVPLSWVNQQAICGTPKTPYVDFESHDAYSCPMQTYDPNPPPVHSLEITSASDDFSQGVKLGLRCPTDSSCVDSFKADSADALFTVKVTGDSNAPSLVKGIAGSLTILPEGYTTVPYPDARSDSADGQVAENQQARASQLLSDVGLVGKIAYDSTSSSQGGWVDSFAPDAGTIVPTGSTVTVVVAGKEGDGGIGTITGTVVAVGGPAGSGLRPFAEAQVTLAYDTGSYGLRGNDDGTYSQQVGSGTYTVTATAPGYEDGKGVCQAQGPVTVANHQTVDVTVYCQEK